MLLKIWEIALYDHRILLSLKKVNAIFNDIENTDINYKWGDKFKKLNDMISLEKWYSLRSSVHKYPQQNLSKSMFEGKDEMLDKLDVIEHTLNTYLKSK